mmetsp:Transcript_12235/g.41487  ORF Transcript_12235/g.41487 Transcript_12235/m.41487 type:complete len:440 (+) Transcript_12235:491-1810(+)
MVHVLALREQPLLPLVHGELCPVERGEGQLARGERRLPLAHALQVPGGKCDRGARLLHRLGVPLDLVDEVSELLLHARNLGGLGVARELCDHGHHHFREGDGVRVEREGLHEEEVRAGHEAFLERTGAHVRPGGAQRAGPVQGLGGQGLGRLAEDALVQDLQEVHGHGHVDAERARELVEELDALEAEGRVARRREEARHAEGHLHEREGEEPHAGALQGPEGRDHGRPDPEAVEHLPVVHLRVALAAVPARALLGVHGRTHMDAQLADVHKREGVRELLVLLEELHDARGHEQHEGHGPAPAGLARARIGEVRSLHAELRGWRREASGDGGDDAKGAQAALEVRGGAPVAQEGAQEPLAKEREHAEEGQEGLELPEHGHHHGWLSHLVEEEHSVLEVRLCHRRELGPARGGSGVREAPGIRAVPGAPALLAALALARA